MLEEGRAMGEKRGGLIMDYFQELEGPSEDCLVKVLRS